jgi:hypothetical protein
MPVSYIARHCPNCFASNLPNPVAATAALAAAVLVGGLIVLGVQAMRSNAPRAGNASSDQAGDTTEGYGWIVQAMAECDEEAKLRTDTMHFLIVPMTSTGMSLPGWSPTPITTVGDAVLLLSSSDAMIGLRNRALALYQRPLSFAVSDPESGTTYRWKPAVGVTALKARDTGWSSLKLGLEVPDLGREIAWGPTIHASKGTCYWVNPLVRSPGRSP